MQILSVQLDVSPIEIESSKVIFVPSSKGILSSVTLNLFGLALAFHINRMIQYACRFLFGFFFNQHIILKFIHTAS